MTIPIINQAPVLRWRLYYRPDLIDIDTADRVLAVVSERDWTIPGPTDTESDRRHAAFIVTQSARSAVAHGWTRGWADVLAAAEGRDDR